MTPRRLVLLVSLALGLGPLSASAAAQGRVVPEPGTTRKPRAVPAPTTTRPRTTRPQTTRKAVRPPAKRPAPKAVPAPGAQPAAPAPVQAPAPAGDLTVTVLTFGIGSEVWERFGHNALWIHDARTGADVAYNWGLFDFEQPGFFRRFLTGDTKYWMGAEDAYAMVSAYQAGGRPITLQTLNLTAAQAQAVDDFVRRNALEENKYYRYDYFRDNCSTRLRDVIDRAVSGSLRRATDTIHTTLSYRSESVRLTEGLEPVQTGIDVALGQPADAPLTAWESFFVPMRLRDGLRVVQVPREDGTLVPLVADERELAPIQGTPRVTEPRAATDHTRRNLMLGLALAAVALLLRLLMRTRRWAAWVLALLGALWSLACGALGTVLLLAWLATKHDFWARNENLLLLSPLSLLLVVLVPAAMLAGRGVRRARILGVVVALMAIGAFVLSQLPGGQPIRPIVALLLPMHAVLAVALLLYLPRRSAPMRPAKG